MYGNGERRSCPECGQSVSHQRDHLAVRELRGPRQITSSNIDRIFDDRGLRFLYIEEKRPEESIPEGQKRLLRSLSTRADHTVWVVRGTPDELEVRSVEGEIARRVSAGGWDAYQEAVGAWFASPLPAAETWLDALASAPFAPPSWCPAEDWNALEKALTVVCALSRNRSAA